jgi:hypothetical protein
MGDHPDVAISSILMASLTMPVGSRTLHNKFTGAFAGLPLGDEAQSKRLIGEGGPLLPGFARSD